MKFYTYFETANRSHLTKDVVQIPLNMSHHFNYDSYLIAEKDFDLGNYSDKLKLLAIGNRKFLKRLNLGFIKFLISNAKKIDVLNLYHFGIATQVYGVLYKLLNNKGFLYVKADHNLEDSSNPFVFNNKKNFYYIVKIINRIFFKCLDKISVECPKSKDVLVGFNNVLMDKILVIRNGVEEKKIISSHVNFKKENIFITVGRLFSIEKNTELLLQALTLIDFKDWKAYLIGQYNDIDKVKIENFYEANPDLRDKVTFTGPINDQELLSSYFYRSKLFLIPSLKEGYPLVMAEALVSGNYIISSDLQVFKEEISESYGTTFPRSDCAALAKCIATFITETNSLVDYSKISHEAADKFNWRNILIPLNKAIRNEV